MWAECEFRDGRLLPKQVVYELLSQGRRLADKLGQELAAVALGDERLVELESLCEYGADRVLRCEHDLLGQYSTAGITNVLSALIASKNRQFFFTGPRPMVGIWPAVLPPACTWFDR